MTQNYFTRRKFLQSSLAVGGLMIVPRHVLGAGHTAPSDELTKAIIGVGGMGRGHIRYDDARLLAVCDVDEKHLQLGIQEAEKRGIENVQGYKDFREVYARPDIDVIHIATPPHWHAVMSIMAAEAGKDIWCEKPMTRTIGEGQKVVEAVNRNSRIFRINTWFRFEGGFYGMKTPVKPIKKLVNSGLLGWPLKITLSESTGFSWKFNWSGKTDLVPQDIPSELDYNYWLGPAPEKPYHPHRVHGTFRGYWDYDGGGLGDMGQHYLDPAQYLLGKDDTSPIEIEMEAPRQHPDAVGSWNWIRYKYADGCEIYLDGENKYKDAAFIEGPGGKLFKEFKSDIPNVEQLLESFPEPEPQVTDFPAAVKTRTKFALNEMNGFRSATLINLGKIAVRLGRPLQFNPVTCRFEGDDMANRLIDQPERDWIATM